MHHAFLYISLPSLHDHDVKMPNFTFCGGRRHVNCFFFPFPELGSCRIQLQKKLPAFSELNGLSKAHEKMREKLIEAPSTRILIFSIHNFFFSDSATVHLAWISPDYFESLLLPRSNRMNFRLPSTRIRWIRHTSPLSRVEIFEYAMFRKRVEAKYPDILLYPLTSQD